jgi:L-aminopeptidase/D-esterase-like protein
MIQPGARNLITDVPGMRVGQAEDAGLRTGVTVVLPDGAASTAVDIRGGAPGTRETDALDPVSLGVKADCIVLSGGSAFGLDAASGVMAWLSERGRGFQLKPGTPRIPIVPAAVIFDLRDAGNFNAADNPYGRLGKAAVANAGAEFALGNAGAGLGAIAGAYKGGVGSASAVIDGAITVGALVVVNSAGSPVIPGTGLFWAFPFEQGKEFGGRRPHAPFPQLDLDLPLDGKTAPLRGANTTIAVVATDAALTSVELKRVAIMATDGFARALRPVHTPFDGDTLFALTTGAKPVSGDRLRELTRIGSVAADCIARAIARGVYAADSAGAVKSYRERFGESL